MAPQRSLKNCSEFFCAVFFAQGENFHKEKVMTKGFGNLIRQAQQLQSKMVKVQEEMASRTVEASAGGGMVVAVANGKQELVSIKIEKEVVNPEDVEMLQDLILAAANAALKNAQEMVAEEMKKLTGGINIPGMM
jgi:nucleoid-associated protein EbfC